MPEVREWYNEFDNSSPGVIWPEKKHKNWMNKGWELAKKIKKMLPDTVDLFYQWEYFEKVPWEYGEGRELGIIVPDERTICDSSKYKLTLF